MSVSGSKNLGVFKSRVFALQLFPARGNSATPINLSSKNTPRPTISEPATFHCVASWEQLDFNCL